MARSHALALFSACLLTTGGSEQEEFIAQADALACEVALVCAPLEPADACEASWARPPEPESCYRFKESLADDCMAQYEALVEQVRLDVPEPNTSAPACFDVAGFSCDAYENKSVRRCRDINLVLQ